VGTWGHSPVVATGSSSRGHHPGPVLCRRPGWSSSHCGVVVAWCGVSSSCLIGCCVVGCHRLALHGRPLWSWCVIGSMTMNNDQCRRSSFGCHVAVGDVVPDSDVKKWTGGRGCECSPGCWPSWLLLHV